MTESTLAATGVGTSEFRVGSAIARSASLLWRHPLTFFVVGLIACSPILVFAGTQISASTPSGTVKELLWIVFNLAVLTVFDTFGKAALVHTAIQDMRGGGRVRLIESLNVSLRQFWPLIGLAFASFLTSLGFVLLVVPGLILSTIWFVALPACIGERLGPWASLRRSLQLTKGHRWKIFGLMLLVLVPTWGSPFVGWLLSTATSEFVGTVGEWLCTTIATAIAAAVVVVTYYDLRVVDEGADITRLAVVFD
jgi:hypothetical protein